MGKIICDWALPSSGQLVYQVLANSKVCQLLEPLEPRNFWDNYIIFFNLKKIFFSYYCIPYTSLLKLPKLLSREVICSELLSGEGISR